jgi:hypothetical protein
LSDAPFRFFLRDKLPGFNSGQTMFDFLPDVQVVLNIFDRAILGQRLDESDCFFCRVIARRARSARAVPAD